MIRPIDQKGGDYKNLKSLPLSAVGELRVLEGHHASGKSDTFLDGSLINVVEN